MVSPRMMIYITLTFLVSFLLGFFWIYYPTFENMRSSKLIVSNAQLQNGEEELRNLKDEDKSDARVGEPFTEKDSDLAFLTDFRLEREKERSRLQERLEELLFTAVDEENSKMIHTRLMELAKRTALEKEVENLLMARGYRDVVAVVHEDSITVVIKGVNLDSRTVSVIGESVGKITGYPLDHIRIVE